MLKKEVLYILVCVCFLVACKTRQAEENKSQPGTEEALMRINKYLVKKDADAIKGFVNRRGWNMTQTKAGLWYEITEHGNGAKAETDKIATLEYKVWLLDGTLCYSSDSLGNKSFVIGKGRVEPGLELGILLLREGDKARFIMLPHLAYGLIGDENRIPARATIVYEVHLLKIADQK